MKSRKRIVLASASPRRKQLLSEHFDVKIFPADISEKPRADENPKIYVRRMAKEKWLAASQKWKSQNPRSNELLFSADTIVVLDSKILGKPKNARDAALMIKKLSGKTHEVLTAFCVGRIKKPRPQKLKMVSTKVRFRALSRDEISSYIRGGDWRGKAGSYGIQGKALEFVDQIQGSLTSVVGLPVTESIQAIAQAYAHPPLKS